MFNYAISDALVQFPLDLGATKSNRPTKAFRSANVSIPVYPPSSLCGLFYCSIDLCTIRKSFAMLPSNYR
jgi:hypothetical protein